MVPNPFERFHYPYYAAGIFGGLGLIVFSMLLAATPIHPLVPFFVRYLGLLVSFFGVVWYAFNWFIDYGVMYLARVGSLTDKDT